MRPTNVTSMPVTGTVSSAARPGVMISNQASTPDSDWREKVGDYRKKLVEQL
jgi:hypothetical protein